ncbi:MAG: RDD family protein [Bacillota bacterium]
MRRVVITTPENIEVAYRLAGPGSRVVAAFIDYFIQGLLYLLIILALAGMDDPLQYLESQNSYAVAIALLIAALINYGYFTVLEMTMDGRTLGKKLLGLKTIRKNGQPIDIKHSLIRNLFKIFIDNYMIGIVMMFFRADESRLGDILSSTMVIEEEKENLHLTDAMLPENVKKHLTEEDKTLLLTYMQEKEGVMVEGERLREKIQTYFRNKYEGVDEEMNRWIENRLNQ